MELLQRGLDALLRPRLQVPVVDDAGAGVPAQEGVVVPGGTYRLRLLVPDHRLAQRAVGEGSRPPATVPELCLREPLADDPRVVGALGLPLQAAEGLPGLAEH